MAKVNIKAARSRAVRVDAFMNMVTGLGTSRDKRLGSAIAPADRLTWADLEEMYAGDAIAAKVVDTLPEEMTREWVEFTQGDDAMAEKADSQKLRKIEAQSSFDWALKMSRLHGGAVIVMGIDDGQDFDKPVRRETIKSLNFLNVLDRWQIYPTNKIYRNPSEPNYGKPEYYRLQPTRHSTDMGKEIHASRLLRFDGVRMPDRFALRNLGWGDSILNRLLNAIRGYHTAHDSANLIIQDFTNGVYTFKGLADLIASGDDGVTSLATRMQMLDLGRSIARAMILDEDEDFKKLSTSVAGLKDLLEATERRLVAESGMPHTRLLGEAPGASLGEGGTSQDRNWYDHVASKQESLMRDPLETLIELVLLSKNGPTNGVVPEEWSLTFKSLWQQDEADVANNRFLQAQTDAIYIDRGVCLPDEIAQSRFGGAGYSTDTVVDIELRDLMTPDPQGEASDV